MDMNQNCFLGGWSFSSDNEQSLDWALAHEAARISISNQGHERLLANNSIRIREKS